jgi:hypothetical protein
MNGFWGFLTSDAGRVTLSILAIVASATIAITLFVLNRKIKRLSYQIISRTRLLSVSQEMAGYVRVLVGDQQVRDVGLVRLKIINTGTEPIKSSDFDRPVSFGVNEDASIILAEIVETKPAGLEPKLGQDLTKITLKPMLLNVRDSVTLKLLVADFDGTIVADARVEGAVFQPYAVPPLRRLAGLGAAVGTGVAVLAVGEFVPLLGSALVAAAASLFGAKLGTLKNYWEAEETAPNDYEKK